jgi:cell wall-associated NlpC family hydrolase
MRASRRASAALLLAGLAAAVVPVSTGTAAADPLGDARARATALRHQVAELRTKAEIATEEYDRAYARLGAAVTAHLSAERELAQAQQTLGTRDDQAERRVRALYMSGGTAALYAHVLRSASPAEVAQRVSQVKVVLQADAGATRTAQGAVTSRAAAEQRLAKTAAESTRLQKLVADKADEVNALLSRTDKLLADADQRVVALVEAQERAATAAATAQAQAAIAAAHAALGSVTEAPPTPQAAAALDFAKAQLGKPYVWGATGPGSYDCSGLTGSAYRAAGISLPRTSREQWYAGTHVSLGELQPGDLLFWAYDTANPATIHHVALYAGNGLMIAAPHSGDVVKVQGVYLEGFVGAVRPVVP